MIVFCSIRRSCVLLCVDSARHGGPLVRVLTQRVHGNLFQSLIGSLSAQKDSAVLPDDVQFSLSTLAAFHDVDAKAVDLTEKGGHVAVAKQIVPGSNRPY